MEIYSEEEKQKYCAGFKKCTLPITDYAEKMNIDVVELKQWLKGYKEPLKYGKINVKELASKEVGENKEKATSILFETDEIKIELKENYDKKLLMKIMEKIFVKKYIFLFTFSKS